MQTLRVCILINSKKIIKFINKTGNPLNKTSTMIILKIEQKTVGELEIMTKVKKKVLEILPSYGIAPLIFAFVFNSFVYSGARIIAGEWTHFNLETEIDRWIPLIPQSILIYFGCYIFWGINYILVARQDKKSVYQFFAGDFLSRCICFFIFIVFPTTNTRPVLAGDGFWEQAVLWLYSIDAADNLLPSIHCLVSWFCYIGIRRRQEIPLWYKRFSCIFAILVFISTLTTKQHVIWDVIAGVLLAELCFLAGRKTKVWIYYGKIADRVEELLILSRKGEVCGNKSKKNTI